MFSLGASIQVPEGVLEDTSAVEILQPKNALGTTLEEPLERDDVSGR